MYQCGLTVNSQLSSLHLDGDTSLQVHLRFDARCADGGADIFPIYDPSGRRIYACTVVDPHMTLDGRRRSSILVARVLVQNHHDPDLYQDGVSNQVNWV